MQQARMQESGTVVRCEKGVAWVRTVQRSACGGCKLRAGCGQSTLQNWMTDADLIAVSVQDQEPQTGQSVELSVAANAVAKAALLVYVLPLLTLLFGAVFANHWLQGDGPAIFGALVGFLLGCAGVRYITDRWANSADLQPRLEAR